MTDEFRTLDDLLTDIESPDPAQRAQAALRIQDFAEAAVDALFRAIARPENQNHRGTLVFVLGSFRCEDRFSELFDLALHGNFEVQNHALSILFGQSFDVTAEKLRQAEQALGELRAGDHLSAEEVELLRHDLQSVLARLSEYMGDTD